LAKRKVVINVTVKLVVTSLQHIKK